MNREITGINISIIKFLLKLYEVNMPNIYETIYKKLQKLIPDIADLQPGDTRKSKSNQYMDLNLDVLDRTEPNKNFGYELITIALSHYYKHDSGDMIPDPDMEIKVCPQLRFAEALTYQDTYGYKQVYPEPGKFYPKLKKDLNNFLNTWLTNCIDQKHNLDNDVIIKSNPLDASEIYINNIKLTPDKSLKINNHSPEDIEFKLTIGFNYGYSGSGPAQLALAILLEAVPKDIAIQHYQQFKSDIIATKTQAEPLQITKTEITHWLQTNIPNIDADKAIKKLSNFRNKTNEL